MDGFFPAISFLDVDVYPGCNNAIRIAAACAHSKSSGREREFKKRRGVCSFVQHEEEQVQIHIQNKTTIIGKKLSTWGAVLPQIMSK